MCLFQSTLPGWGTTHDAAVAVLAGEISIHAPRMGSDRAAPRPDHTSMNFNPRSPDGERPFAGVTDGPACIFQSTLPGWGATTASTTAWTGTSRFQSTLPGWGATGQPHRTHRYGAISIHAPRMGSDLFVRFAQPPPGYFNPRSPDGERQVSFACPCGFARFQSTLPGWGATVVGDFARYASHAFQSTLPGWGATISQALVDARQRISIHAPRMGSDHTRDDGEHVGRGISIHAPRMGSDRENGHLRPRYGQNHPFSTLIVSQIVVDVLGTVRKSQKHQRTSHYEVIKQPERQK